MTPPILGDDESPEYADPLPDDLAIEAPNEPLPIYEGQIDLSYREWHASGHAAIAITWAPRPALVCRVDFEPSGDGSIERIVAGDPNRDVTFHVSGASGAAKIRAGSWNPDNPWAELRLYDQVTIDHGLAASHVRFELVNMESVYGSPVSYGEFSWGADRLRLTSMKWAVDLDGLRRLHEVEKQLNGSGGFAITHKGQAVLNDGRAVTPNDVPELFTTLQYSLSFAHRRWVTPTRARGLTSSGDLAWEVWGLWNTKPWSQPLTWFDGRSDEALSEVFSAINDRWRDRYWERLLRTAIHYYLDASGGLVNRGIILGASLLELVAWHVVVEDRQLLTDKAFDRLEASDRLRMLLRLMNVPVEISRHDTPALARFARQNWDLANVMTEIRHLMVHAKRRGSLWELEDAAWTEASMMNSRLCDLALLFLLDYSGQYVDPFFAKFAADSRSVPWRE